MPRRALRSGTRAASVFNEDGLATATSVGERAGWVALRSVSVDHDVRERFVIAGDEHDGARSLSRLYTSNGKKMSGPFGPLHGADRPAACTGCSSFDGQVIATPGSPTRHWTFRVPQRPSHRVVNESWSSAWQNLNGNDGIGFGLAGLSVVASNWVDGSLLAARELEPGLAFLVIATTSRDLGLISVDETGDIDLEARVGTARGDVQALALARIAGGNRALLVWSERRGSSDDLWGMVVELVH